MRFWRQTLLAFAGVVLVLPVWATPTVSVENNWNCELASLSNAGDYYPSTLESDTSSLWKTCPQQYLSISGLNGETWTLKAKLLNDGSNTLDITKVSIDLKVDNGAYQQLSTADLTTPLLTGIGNQSSISIYFKIGSFDVDIGHGSKQLNIQYQLDVTPATP